MMTLQDRLTVAAWLIAITLVAAIGCILATVSTVRAEPLAAIVAAAAIAEGVPVAIGHAVIRHESNYRPHLRGRAGEWGLGQIKCGSARSLGFSGACSALAQADINARFSMRYLRLALAGGGDLCARLSRYQRGLGAPARCTPYARAVLARIGHTP